jgi:hypothetical protein
MADAVTSQTLFDDGGHVVVHLTNVSDGTGESAVIKVDASPLIGGGTMRYALEAIAWATVGMGFNLLWDGTADVLFFTTNSPWIKALAEVRHRATREGWCYLHIQAITIAIDQ